MTIAVLIEDPGDALPLVDLGRRVASIHGLPLRVFALSTETEGERITLIDNADPEPGSPGAALSGLGSPHTDEKHYVLRADDDRLTEVRERTPSWILTSGRDETVLTELFELSATIIVTRFDAPLIDAASIGVEARHAVHGPKALKFGADLARTLGSALSIRDLAADRDDRRGPRSHDHHGVHGLPRRGDGIRAGWRQ